MAGTINQIPMSKIAVVKQLTEGSNSTYGVHLTQAGWNGGGSILPMGKMDRNPSDADPFETSTLELG